MNVYDARREAAVEPTSGYASNATPGRRNPTQNEGGKPCANVSVGQKRWSSTPPSISGLLLTADLSTPQGPVCSRGSDPQPIGNLRASLPGALVAP